MSSTTVVQFDCSFSGSEMWLIHRHEHNSAKKQTESVIIGNFMDQKLSYEHCLYLNIRSVKDLQNILIQFVDEPYNYSQDDYVKDIYLQDQQDSKFIINFAMNFLTQMKSMKQMLSQMEDGNMIQQLYSFWTDFERRSHNIRYECNLFTYPKFVWYSASFFQENYLIVDGLDCSKFHASDLLFNLLKS